MQVGQSSTMLADKPSLAQRSSASTSLHRPPRLLIVDDDQTCCLMIARLLKPRGYDIECLFTAHDAIERQDGRAFDLLICDWILKNGKDGVDVAKALCGHWPALRVIFMTGLSAQDLARATRSLPVVGIFQKPLPFDSLLDAIDSVVDPPSTVP